MACKWSKQVIKIKNCKRKGWLCDQWNYWREISPVLCHCLLQPPAPVESSTLPKSSPEPLHWTVYTFSPGHLCFCAHLRTHSISYLVVVISFFCECEAPHVKTISELFGMGELTSRHDGMNLLCDHSLSWRKDASLSLPTINFCTMFNICIIILQ